MSRGKKNKHNRFAASEKIRLGRGKNFERIHRDVRRLVMSSLPKGKPPKTWADTVGDYNEHLDELLENAARDLEYTVPLPADASIDLLSSILKRIFLLFLLAYGMR